MLPWCEEGAADLRERAIQVFRRLGFAFAAVRTSRLAVTDLRENAETYGQLRQHPRQIASELCPKTVVLDNLERRVRGRCW